MLRHACSFALANKGHDTRSLQAYLGPYSAYGSVYGAVARPVQELLAVRTNKSLAQSHKIRPGSRATKQRETGADSALSRRQWELQTNDT